MSWLRLYTEIIDDPKVMQLEPRLFKTWMLTLCMAKDNHGYLPSMSFLAFKLRLREDIAKQHVDALIKAGLIDVQGEQYQPHNWSNRQYESDTSKERTKAYRERKKQGGSDAHVTSQARHGNAPRVQSIQSTEYREELPPPPAAGARPIPTGPDPEPELHAAVNRIAAFWPNPGRVPYAITAACNEFGHGKPGQSVADWTRKVESNAMLHADHHRRGRQSNSRHFIPTLERWFVDGDYSRDPPEQIQSSHQPAPVKTTAMQRVMAKIQAEKEKANADRH